MGPVVELCFPVGLLGGGGGGALVAGGVAGQRTVGQAGGEGPCCSSGVAADADGDLLDEAEHLGVGVDLDDPGIGGPVVHVVLGQGAERAEPGAEGEHDIGAGDELHGGLGALIAEWATPLRVAGREGVVVEVRVHDGAAEAFGQFDGLGDGVAHDHAATGQQHGELRGGQQVGGLVEALLAAGAAFDADGFGDLDVDLAIEAVARDVELGGAHLEDRPVEATGGELGHALLVDDMALVLGELLEHRELVGLLEAAEADAHGAGLGGDDDDGAVGPEGGGDGGHAVGDAGAVLADDDAVAAADPGEAVGHVGGALFVDDGHEADAGRGEDVHGIHEGRTHDAEGCLDAVGDQGLDEGLAGGHAGHRLLLGEGGRGGAVTRRGVRAYNAIGRVSR